MPETCRAVFEGQALVKIKSLGRSSVKNVFLILNENQVIIFHDFYSNPILNDYSNLNVNMTTRLYRTLTPDTRERSISGFNGEVQSHPQPQNSIVVGKVVITEVRIYIYYIKKNVSIFVLAEIGQEKF